MNELLLQMIARYFAFGHETPKQRQVLASTAVGLMFTGIKPLGLLLARLPVGPELPDATAGANFQLPSAPASCCRTAAPPGSGTPSAWTSWPCSPVLSIRRPDGTWWRRCPQPCPRRPRT